MTNWQAKAAFQWLAILALTGILLAANLNAQDPTDCLQPIIVGLNEDVHFDYGGMVANDFHIEGVIKSKGPLPPQIGSIIIFGDPNTGNWSATNYSLTYIGNDTWWFQVDFITDGTIQYCQWIHFGVQFWVYAYNLIIDLKGWWTFNGQPIAQAPVSGFWMDDLGEIRPDEQTLRLTNDTNLTLEILSLELAKNTEPIPLEHLTVEGLGRTGERSPLYPYLEWIAVDGLPKILEPASFFDIFVEDLPLQVMPGEFLLIRGQQHDVREPAGDWGWFYEIHGANPPTCTPTPTETPEETPTPTPTDTPTRIPTSTLTPTDTPTRIPTFTPTLTPTNTPTETPACTCPPTDTPTNTPTATPTKVPTLVPYLDLVILSHCKYNPNTHKQRPNAVRVELRDGPSPDQANIRVWDSKDDNCGGVILDENGHALLELVNLEIAVADADYYLKLSGLEDEDEGELAVISEQKLTFVPGEITYVDFSHPSSPNFVPVYGENALMTEKDGALSMWCGDLNGDQIINVADFALWRSGNGMRSYAPLSLAKSSLDAQKDTLSEKASLSLSDRELASSAAIRIVPSAKEVKAADRLKLVVEVELKKAGKLIGVDASLVLDDLIFSRPIKIADNLVDLLDVSRETPLTSDGYFFHYSKVSLGNGIAVKSGRMKLYELEVSINKDAPRGKANINFARGFVNILTDGGLLSVKPMEAAILVK